jgi:hypothetical protein
MRPIRLVPVLFTLLVLGVLLPLRLVRRSPVGRPTVWSRWWPRPPMGSC